ncbi:MAG: glycosyltransferase, partial [Parcubacteria group bacterium]|nr:glycosyltransferase [Parcubacteria group bacterium]
ENSERIIRPRPFIRWGNAAILPQVWNMIPRYDWIHLHWPFFGTSEIIWLKYALGAPSAKLAITYHMEFITDNWLKALLAWPSRAILKNLVRQAAFITVSSFDYIKNSGDRHLFEDFQDKFKELPFGAHPHFSPGHYPSALSRRFPKASHEKIILFVGGIDRAHYFKGLSILIQSFTQIKNHAKLIIAGEGELREEYEKLVLRLGLSAKIHFMGAVADDELLDYYRFCDVFVLPSLTRGEAFGLVLVNAMAVGKPVIASNLPGVRTVVDDEYNGLLVNPGDIAGLGEAIDKILSSPELARDMGSRGQEKARQEYQWENIVRKLNGYYKVAR